MEIVFTPEAITHLSEWQKSGNTAVQKKNSGIIAIHSGHTISRGGETRSIETSTIGEMVETNK